MIRKHSYDPVPLKLSQLHCHRISLNKGALLIAIISTGLKRQALSQVIKHPHSTGDKLDLQYISATCSSNTITNSVEMRRHPRDNTQVSGS